MLNKVLIGTIINFVLQMVNAIFPGVLIPEGFNEILAEFVIVLVVFLAQFFTKESIESVQKLILKVPT